MTFLYERVLKPVLFRFDPELMHDAFTTIGSWSGRIAPARWWLSFVYRYRHPALRQTIAGIAFENPVGLAAGFDKDCKLLRVMPAMGFGFEEVGSLTAEPYEGNLKPRLVRLPKDQALIVYYGLKNQGAAIMGERLRSRSASERVIPVGVSVAKTNKAFDTEREKLNDWIRGIDMLKDAGDYLTINVSCPNVYDPTNFCDPKLLEKLLKRIEKERLVFTKPVFLKITADLSFKQMDEIIALCKHRAWITGFILTNLVKDRSQLALKSPKEAYEPFKGGISGKVVQPRAIDLVRYVRKKTDKRFVLIGCGGIFTAEDAYAYIKAGANLVQLITGMIYRGPGTIKEINKGLVRLLKKDGRASIADAVGADQ